MPGFARGRYDDNLFMEHMVAHPFGQMAVVMDMIAGGVCDRFPGLRVGFFESGLGWIPYWLDRLDEHFEVMGRHTPWLVRPPSEIFREQCFVSMEAEELTGLRWMLEKDLLPVQHGTLRIRRSEARDQAGMLGAALMGAA